MVERPLVIYHGGCDDGFASAVILHKYFKGEVDLYPGIYQQPPPNCEGRWVIMADFSYKRSVMEKLIPTTSKFFWYDHHKSAIEDMAGYKWRHQDVTILDMERSGSGIVADAYRLRTKPISYIEDRDLWRFRFEQTRRFSAALRSYNQDMNTWHRILFEMGDDALGSFLDEGDGILRYHDKLVNDIASKAYPISFDLNAETSVDGRCANAPYAFASDVANQLAQNAVFGCCWYTDGNRTFYSLRSKDGGIDVSEIAKVFGGGGHKHAAGFAVEGLPQ